jgi:copper chaperone NosL
MKHNLSETKIVLPRLVLAFAAGLLVSSLFLPIWQIQLTAPQYPEGLALKIYAHKLAGDVDVVNGLNHYIGMATLHTKDFIEFTVLPFIIVFLIAMQMLTVFINRKKMYLINAIIFLVLAFVCMGDFYRWEYNYGHNLNPDAPIQIPDMSYTPPLIGYKQLLNFSAYSIPDKGGWTYISAGVLIVFSYVLILQPKWLHFKKTQPVLKKSYAVASILLLISFSSCSQQPQPVNYGKEACSFCKMTIMDEKFACAYVTKKGKDFHFDDMYCLISFLHENKVSAKDVTVYVNDFLNEHHFLKANESFLVKDASLKTPMGGHVAAFSSQTQAQQYIQQHGGSLINFSQLITQ